MTFALVFALALLAFAISLATTPETAGADQVGLPPDTQRLIGRVLVLSTVAVLPVAVGYLGSAWGWWPALVARPMGSGWVIAPPWKALIRVGLRARTGEVVHVRCATTKHWLWPSLACVSVELGAGTQHQQWFVYTAEHEQLVAELKSGIETLGLEASIEP